MSNDPDYDFDLRLARYLSSKESRSGEAIAGVLGCSRTAVWKHINSLRVLGLGIDAVAGQGYRLQNPLELLDEALIRRELSALAASRLNHIEMLVSVGSTNSYLLKGSLEALAGTVVFAERQTAGRGRRGKPWVSPFACNVYMSLCWQFDSSVGELACLPLVVALSAAAALDRVGMSGHQIKWPNDLLLRDHKLAGCLVEVQGDASGPCHAVIGVGINVRMPQGMPALEPIDQAWTDVASSVPGVSRNQCAGALLDELVTNLAGYGQEGFAAFQGQWRSRDCLAGRQVEIAHHNQLIRGKVTGISDRGGLLLETAGTVAEYLAGEVSVTNRDC